MNQPAQQQDAAAEQPAPPAGLAGGGLPPIPTGQHADAVAEWLRWHALELAGIGVPLALAVAVSVWFAVLAAPVAGLWAAHEIRQARRRALPPGRRAALTTTPASGEESSEDE